VVGLALAVDGPAFSWRADSGRVQLPHAAGIHRSPRPPARLANLSVQTCDMREFETSRRFDRVVSVEMFEHLRNYALLFRRISDWLAPGRKLFAHIFCHRYLAYEFETRDAADWMARHFFTGGIMPSADLLLRFQEYLVLEQQWSVNGRHYARTCEDWLANLDRHRDRLLTVLAEGGDDVSPAVALQRWRMFFMACAELFRYRGGNEWYVGHYRFCCRT